MATNIVVTYPLTEDLDSAIANVVGSGICEYSEAGMGRRIIGYSYISYAEAQEAIRRLNRINGVEAFEDEE